MGELARKIHSITPEDLNNTKLFGLKADWKKMYENVISNINNHLK